MVDRVREQKNGQMDPGSGEQSLKLVYYGPGRSGKSENLRALARILEVKLPISISLPDASGKPIATFETLDIPAGHPEGSATALQLISVPGHHTQAEIRNRLLEQITGIVFVADSRSDRQDANLIALDELGTLLMERRIPLRDLPLVLQLNRQDAADALPVAELRARLIPDRCPVIPTCAKTGRGIQETLAMMIDILETRG